MSRQVLHDLVRVRGNHLTRLTLNFDYLVERPHYRRFAIDDTKHILWSFIEAAGLGEMAIERQGNANLKRREFPMAKEVKVLVKGDMGLVRRVLTRRLSTSKL